MRISDWSSDVCSSDLAGSSHIWRPDYRDRPRAASPGTFRLKPCSCESRSPGPQATPPAALDSRVRGKTEMLQPRRDQPSSRSEEHTSELQSLMRISYAVFCLKTKKKNNRNIYIDYISMTQIPTNNHSS